MDAETAPTVRRDAMKLARDAFDWDYGVELQSYNRTYRLIEDVGTKVGDALRAVPLGVVVTAYGVNEGIAELFKR